MRELISWFENCLENHKCQWIKKMFVIAYSKNVHEFFENVHKSKNWSWMSKYVAKIQEKFIT